MATYLDEDQVGQDFQIGYPHLLLCMGVTLLMTDGSLVGAHVSYMDTEAAVMNKLVALLGALPPGVTPLDLYLAGNVAIHCVKDRGRNEAQEAVAKAQALNFHGNCYLFDTSMI